MIARFLASKALRCALALTLAVGLAPSVAFAAPEGAGDEGSEAVPSSSSALVTTEDAPSVEGQALVLYRTPGADEGDATARSAGDDAAVLADQGVSVLQTWDFSAVDEAQEQGVLSARAVEGVEAGAGGDIPSGDDVRVALVAREGVSTEDLIAELLELDCVEAAQPNYVLSFDEGTDAEEEPAQLSEGIVETAAQSATTLEASNATGDAAGAEGSDASEAVAGSAVETTDSAAGSVVDDPYYTVWQGYLHEGDASIDLEAALAAREQAQAAGTLEENIVAVIDTGVDTDHPDLADNLWTNPGIPGLPGEAGSYGYDFGDHDSDPRPTGQTSSDSHGTHCAGIIAAATDNAEGIAGASSDTRIMALKIAADTAGGFPLTSAAVESYQYVVGALLAGENVVAVNNSYNAGFYAPVLDYLVNQAGKVGALSFFSAMNEASDTSTKPEYAASVGLQSPYAISVASSNSHNALSSFSNYSETEVDVAAPGSNILSAVSTRAAKYYFDPLLSHQAGRELLYYQDFADFAENQDAYQVMLVRSDGQAVLPSDYEALAVTPEPNAVAGEPGLRFTIDASKLSAPIAYYRVQVTWASDNPFYGSSAPASDYTMGVAARIDTEASPETTGMTAVAQLMTIDDAGTAQLAANGMVQIPMDNYAIASTAIAATHPECERALYAVVVMLADNMDAAATAGVYSGTLTGVGVGKVAGEGVTAETSAFEPYALMSGTSMASPLLAGSAAQLAAFYPDASALELRGMVVGGTVPISDTTMFGMEKHTATDGRFDWDVVLNPAAISANTWSLDADPAAGTATVHGYALGDASVTLDGEAVEMVAQSDSAVTFAVPAEAFDGEAHRVDVTDASTGRVHRASYALSERTAHSALEYVSELPPDIEAQHASGVLVDGGDALYLAAADGSYLYRTDCPESGVWEVLATPPALEQEGARSDVSYAMRDGKLFAVYLQELSGDAAGNAFATYCAVYDAEQNAWTPFDEVERTCEGSMPGGSMINKSNVAVVDGRVFATVSFVATDSAGGQHACSYLYQADAGSDELRPMGMVTAGDETDVVVTGLAAVDGTLCALAGVVSDMSANAGSFHALSCDTDTGTWTDEGVLAGTDIADDEMVALLWASTSQFGSGLLMAVATGEGDSDLAYIDLAEQTWAGLGSYGTAAFSSGTVISSLAAFDGDVYVNAFDATDDGDTVTGALYCLPYLALEQASGQACPTEGYADVDQGQWYHEGVDWAVRTQVMTGYGDEPTKFGPDDAATRAQMAQVLYNLAQQPAVMDPAPFTDCAPGAWYDDAVAWAAGEGLVKGYEDGSGRFGPDDVLTREQLATMLWRLAGEPAGTGGGFWFPDGSTVSDWASEAVAWAVDEGILQGYADSGLLDPTGDVTRGQLATILMRLAEQGVELRSLSLPEA